MPDMKLQAVLLAAGEGTRMKSDKSKVLHEIAGRTLLDHVMKAIPETELKPIIVVGRNANEIGDFYGDRVVLAEQTKRLGTGHAVMCARGAIESSGADVVLIVAGDMPLFTPETLHKLCSKVLEGGADAAVLTAVLDDPTGYGRIVRDENGKVLFVVEQKDATEEQLKIHETNVSGYCVKKQALFDALDKLGCDNVQHEYYITDIVKLMSDRGLRVETYVTPDPGECAGINDRVQLAKAAEAMRDRINEKLMRSGVTLVDPKNTYIDSGVSIGRDSIIYPSVVIKGSTVIGERCEIYSGSHIENCVIGNEVQIRSSYMFDGRIGDRTTVGPFAYIRPGTVIGERTRIGDFVEIKNSVIGNDTKVSHLTYIGDADVGERVNVGCGTVFVNYDGKKKYRTTVGNDVFIGCNTNLVAPVTVSDGAYTAAGSTITREVPKDALAVARARQENKDGWAKRRREKKD